MSESSQKPSRRSFLKTGTAATLAAAGLGASAYYIGGVNRVSRSFGTKVIVLGIDGMDPRLCRRMMKDGRLPNMARLSSKGSFSDLATSMPPQSPVAWANFINGNGPGSHGIFDFIHRHPEEQCMPFYSAAETLPGEGYVNIGDHRLQLDFWPFNHQPPKTVLKRQGTPFWDFLDAQSIPTTFYDLPSNYPPSPSEYGNHQCLCGMGTPDMLGTYGTYQYFSEDTPSEGVEEGGGKRSRVMFAGEAARLKIVGPEHSMLKIPAASVVEMNVYRDRAANAAIIEVDGHKTILTPGQWSPWTKLNFKLSAPTPLPSQSITGICRFLVQEVAPNFRLYVSPVNIDPSQPAVTVSEPTHFASDIAKDLGLFYTTGFQEDHKARSNGIFMDDEYLKQATLVLDERLELLEYAVKNYEDGLLFFYFSSSDLQSHMFWWNADENSNHPSRSTPEAQKYFAHIQQLYQRLDQVVGDLDDRYGSQATIIVMSDHGFANFGRQFNLNSWLRDFGFLNPSECSSILTNPDWSRTKAYGLGINGLYLNLKGRERDGIVEPGEEQEQLTRKLIARLQSVRDFDGKKVINKVYRADEIYQGAATTLAPDLIVGYARGYRASWATCLGELTPDVLMDNDSAWSADHCADALEVPGILCCNHKLTSESPSLIDIAPSILATYGLKTPSSMSGKNVFSL